MPPKAKKYLGQNFLEDKNVLKRIASLLEIESDDEIVEIGPGHGELTKEILAFSPKKLSSIEKDADLWPIIADGFAKNKAFSLIKGDALDILPEVTPKKRNWKIGGNIPYYITGHLLRMIGELPNPPVLAVFTVQKEVAERACSLPPNMNLLSASIGFWAESSMGGIIKKESFRPVPKIDSAILIIRRKKNIPEDAAKYYETMRALFKQPRKTILNNLSDGLKKTKEEAADIIKNAELDIASRSQNLSVEDILNIANKTPR